MNGAEKKQFVEKIHRQFIDSMYPDFGWENKPNYAKIEVVPLLSLGGTIISSDVNRTIYINSDLEGEVPLIATPAHESGHSIYQMHHVFARRAIDAGNVDERGRVVFSDYEVFLGENVAELGALVFVSRHYPLLLTEAKKYSREVRGSFALKLFKKDSGLLKKLSCLDVEPARDLILKEIGEDISIERLTVWST